MVKLSKKKVSVEEKVEIPEEQVINNDIPEEKLGTNINEVDNTSARGSSIESDEILPKMDTVQVSVEEKPKNNKDIKSILQNKRELTQKQKEHMKKMVMKRKESQNVKKNVMKKVETLIKMGFNLDNIIEKAEKENIKLNYEK